MNNHEPRHTIAPSGLPRETVEWLEWRGYRAAVVTPHRTPANFLPVLGSAPVATSYDVAGKVGVMFGRKNQPLILAQVGDVLVWDGSNVVIEE